MCGMHHEGFGCFSTWLSHDDAWSFGAGDWALADCIRVNQSLYVAALLTEVRFQDFSQFDTI